MMKHNFFLMPVFVIFPMPFQKLCSFSGHSQHGTNGILNRNYIPAAALKTAKSEYGIGAKIILFWDHDFF